MRKHRKHKGEGGFNVWRAYSDMMAGLLLLFVLIMCVTLFQAQKSYDDSIKERDDKLALQQQYTAEIENKQNTVDEQANQIQSQDELLASQQAALDELAAKLASQQATLDDQAAKLSDQESQLNTQSALLSQQQSDPVSYTHLHHGFLASGQGSHHLIQRSVHLLERRGNHLFHGI